MSARRPCSRLCHCLVEFLGFDSRSEVLATLSSQHIDTFVVQAAARHGRGSLQHLVSQLRSFLRFLASCGKLASGLDTGIHAPPTHRDE